MNLIYQEYIQFLKDKGIDTNKYNLEEGFFWLDRQIIKAYDKQGSIHKVLRLNIQDDLSIITKEYKKENFEIESWQETVERNKDRLIELEKESLELIRDNIEKYDRYKPMILTSTGKDSQVVTYLVEQIVKPRKIFNNTTLDCSDTYKFVKSMEDVEIITPKEGYYQWRERYNIINTRLNRGCCTIFKEKATMDFLDKDEKYLMFLGMRNSESAKRSNYTDGWKNEKWGNRQWQGILPIRKWDEEDIWLYTLLKGISINAKYFKGYSRVGCAVSCPNYSKSTWVLDQYWYPKMYDRWHKILEKDFINNKKASILNCSLSEYHLNWNGGVVHDKPSEEVIKEFSEQQELSYEIAKKYFNKTCTCGKKLKKDEIGMFLKRNGRFEGYEDNREFLCQRCFCEKEGITKKEYKEQIKKFKESNCALF